MYKLSKSTFTACIPVLVFSHENAFSTSCTITFFSGDLISLYAIKLVYGDMPLRFALAISHLVTPAPYLLALDPLGPDLEAAAACLAFSFSDFSSSSSFFLSAFEIPLSILYLGSCFFISSSLL